MEYNLLVILGPTASGKTRIGVGLARLLNGEIISADSRQVYRGMDIGTGKDLREYDEIPYHLIDIVEPGSEFNVFSFQRKFFDCFSDIQSRKKLPLLVGGTGMYIDAVLRGYRLIEVPENPELRQELSELSHETLVEKLTFFKQRPHNTTDLLDRERLVRAIEICTAETVHGDTLPPLPEIKPLIFGVRWERSQLRKRITARLAQRLEQGMIEEVNNLHESGVPWDKLEFYGLEYRFIAQHLQGLLDRKEMIRLLNTAIHQFAKRQETWFRRMEKQGTIIHWLDGAGNPVREALQYNKNLL